MRARRAGVRAARAGDGAGCAAVWVDMGRYYQALDPGAFQVPRLEGLAESFERDIVSGGPGRLVLVAEAGGGVVGLAAAELREPGAHPEWELARDLGGRRVFVQALGVLAAHRREGVATSLMAAVEDWARERDAGAVVLDTFLGSPSSVPFYERIGYGRRAVVFRKGLG